MENVSFPAANHSCSTCWLHSEASVWILVRVGDKNMRSGSVCTIYDWWGNTKKHR